MNESHKKFVTVSWVVCLFFVMSLLVHRVILSNEISKYEITWQSQNEVLNSFAKIDKVRKENMAKVVTVINRYNDLMPATLKYRIASEISDASVKYDNLDVDLICAIITHESALTWDPTVVSPVGALGLMQVMPATGKFLAEIENLEWTTPEEILFEPAINIRLGSRYLSSMIELYDVDGGLAAYNGGGKRAELWLAQNRADGILFAETQNYVPAVLGLYEEFRH